MPPLGHISDILKRIFNTQNGTIKTELSGSNIPLLDAVSTTGAGTPVAVNTFKNYVFEVYGTATSFALQMQVVGVSETPYNLKVWDELNNTFLTGDITAKGFYSVSVPSFANLQANIVSVSGGNVSVVGGLMQ